MNLNKRQVAFLKDARMRDARQERYHAMWSLKSHRAILAADGAKLHAIPSDPRETFAFRVLTGPNGEREFALSALLEADAPKIGALDPGKPLASMWINPALLLNTLRSLGPRRGECIKLSIHRIGKDGFALSLSGVVSNVGSFYAMIMGMVRHSWDKQTWDPWSDDDAYHALK